jgi:UDP-N-acetylmuramate dehydrogenase
MFRHTTLRIGGPADVWVAPRSIACLQRVMALCFTRRVPCCVVGAGSNLLVRDGGIRGVVVSSEGLRGLRFAPGPEDLPGSARVFVEAGVSTGKLLSEATRRDLGGVEFLGGVPGSVGGGLVMNAGTYLGEFKDVTTHVLSIRPDGSQVLRPHAECGFVYRGSALPRDEVIVEGQLLLRPRPRAAIEADVRALRERRKAREPKGFPNAGSFFKNPPGDFAGRLIEAAGLKGTRIGSAEVAQAHANWILNVASRASEPPVAAGEDEAAGARSGRTQVPGSARDTLQLIEQVRSAVLARFGVALELEVRLLGEDAG